MHLRKIYRWKNYWCDSIPPPGTCQVEFLVSNYYIMRHYVMGIFVRIWSRGLVESGAEMEL